MAIEVRITWSRHPLTISREAQERAAAAVLKAAHDIEGMAKRVVPVDTGNLKNSIQAAEAGDMAATIAYIREPKAPMPKLFPDLINEQSVIDVANFLHEELK